MRILSLIALLIAFFTATAAEAQAQVVISNSQHQIGVNTESGPCAQSSSKGKLAINLFLNASRWEEERKDLGMGDLRAEEVQRISDAATCEKLSEVIRKDSEPLHDEDEWGRFYYRAEDFFFITYVRKKLQLGGRAPFYVLNEDYEVIGSYNI